MRDFIPLQEMVKEILWCVRLVLNHWLKQSKKNTLCKLFIKTMRPAYSSPDTKTVFLY